ncbi:MAG: hypothetical protein WBZ20_05670, partial [Nitrososphaeraceae archaeon]
MKDEVLYEYACGSPLTSITVCKICNEHICWVCSRCNKIEDITHTHLEFIEAITHKKDIGSLISITPAYCNDDIYR